MSTPPAASADGVAVEMAARLNPATAAALHSALGRQAANNNADGDGLQGDAMAESSDFSLQAAPSVDLYLETQIAWYRRR